MKKRKITFYAKDIPCFLVLLFLFAMNFCEIKLIAQTIAPTPPSLDYGMEIFRPEFTRFASPFSPFTNQLKGANLSVVYDSGSVKNITKYVLDADIILPKTWIEAIEANNAFLFPIWQPNLERKAIAIPYIINGEITAKNKNTILEAVEYFNKAFSSRIIFTPRTKETNYVHFVQTENSYSSNIGMIGGEQLIEIGKEGKIGYILHEMAHTLGLLHEHQRGNSPTYLQIFDDHILAQYKSNFQKLDNYTQPTDYDYNSLMHYRCDAFSIQPPLNVNGTILNGLKTINALHDIGTVTLGQRAYKNEATGLTAYFTPSDIEDALFLYPHIKKVTSNATSEKYAFHVPSPLPNITTITWKRISTAGVASNLGTAADIVVPTLQAGEKIQVEVKIPALSNSLLVFIYHKYQ
ncbi:MAG: M12 family metallopeptidase [Bacteroidia bacterium]